MWVVLIALPRRDRQWGELKMPKALVKLMELGVGVDSGNLQRDGQVRNGVGTEIQSQLSHFLIRQAERIEQGHSEVVIRHGVLLR